jgi:hypothetical protein
MPQDVIERVNTLGRRSHAHLDLAFAWHDGTPILDEDEDGYESAYDSNYDPNNDTDDDEALLSDDDSIAAGVDDNNNNENFNKNNDNEDFNDNDSQELMIRQGQPRTAPQMPMKKTTQLMSPR